MDQLQLRHILVFFLLSFAGLRAKSQQSPFSIQAEPYSVFLADGSPQSLSAAGGVYSPQYQEIRLDGDEFSDLVVYDRQAEVLRTFVYKDGDYVYAPYYEHAFPEIKDWFRVVDFNGDGVSDILTSSYDYPQQGIKLWLGQRNEKEEMSFVLRQPHNNYVEPVLTFESEESGRLHIYVSDADIPSFVDVDGDEDIDILTFDPGGSYLYLYENISEDQNVDNIDFVLSDRCWGRVYESGNSSEVTLSTDGRCPTIADINRTSRHAGSTIYATDLDGDDDVDVLLGDLSYEFVSFLENGESQGVDRIVRSIPNFPEEDTAVAVADFPAISSLDVDQDGLKDLIFSPNRFPLLDVESSWYYRNTGEGFSLMSKNWLADRMFDLGSVSSSVYLPAYGDIEEGLITFYSNGMQAGYVRSHFSNQDSVVVVSTAEVNGSNQEDWLFGKTEIRPSDCVLLQDGRRIVALGFDDGTVSLAEIDMENRIVNVDQIEGLDVGFGAAPTFFDYNDDGHLDLIIGELNGNLNYFENQALDEGEFLFSEQPTADFFGRIDVRRRGFFEGYSCPRVVQEGDKAYLLCGSAKGSIEIYEVVKTQAEAQFPLVSDDLLGGHSVGKQVTLGMQESEGNRFLWLGNVRGGTNRFRLESGGSITSDRRHQESADITVYPSVVDHGVFYVKSDMPLSEIRVYNVSGQLCLSKDLGSSPVVHEIQFESSNVGMYFVVAHGVKGEIWYEKIIIPGR